MTDGEGEAPGQTAGRFVIPASYRAQVPIPGARLGTLAVDADARQVLPARPAGGTDLRALSNDAARTRVTQSHGDCWAALAPYTAQPATLGLWGRGTSTQTGKSQPTALARESKQVPARRPLWGRLSTGRRRRALTSPKAAPSRGTVGLAGEVAATALR